MFEHVLVHCIYCLQRYINDGKLIHFLCITARSLNITSINVNGIRTNENRANVFTLLSACNDQDVKLWFHEWEGQVCSSDGFNLSRYVAVVFVNSKLSLDII